VARGENAEWPSAQIDAADSVGFLSGLQLSETGFIMIYPYLFKKTDGKSGKTPKFEKSIGDCFTKEIERGLR